MRWADTELLLDLHLLCLLGAAAGQQRSLRPKAGSHPSQSTVISESQSPSCKPQAPTATNPFDTCKYRTSGTGIRPRKRCRALVDPTYPEAARKAKLNGSVVLAVAINEEGAGGRREGRALVGPDFEQNAMDAARQDQFLPATKDGKPVADADERGDDV